MEHEKKKSTEKQAGSNWDALKKSVKPSKKHLQRSSFKKKPTAAPKPKPKPATDDDAVHANPGRSDDTSTSALASGSGLGQGTSNPDITSPIEPAQPAPEKEKATEKEYIDKETLAVLRTMVLGEIDTTDTSKSKPGLYLAIDCEMVGVGPVNQTKQGSKAAESSLARVSVVNFHGVVMLDFFVKQKERVTDYRTQWSGVRREDLIGTDARPFEEVQRNVAGLIKDRVVVGHAVRNDLKMLLLTHPGGLIRDTQACPLVRKKFNTQRVALRTVVKQDLGITIQAGEHSSVVDARAAMAIFRIYKSEWDKTLPAKARHAILQLGDTGAITSNKNKRKRSATESEDAPACSDDRHSGPSSSSSAKKQQKRQKQGSSETGSGGGRRGVSSGLSVIVTRKNDNASRTARGDGGKWWSSFEGKGITEHGSKGSLRVKSTKQRVIL